MIEFNDDIIEKVKADNFINFLGIKILKIGKGYALVSLKMKEQFLNFNGMVHGGIIYSVADVAFSLASNSFGIPAVAVQVSINFLKPVNVDDELMAEVKLKKYGKTLSLYEMEVVNREKKLTASLSGTVFQFNKEKEH